MAAGIKSVHEFARASGVSRKAVTSAEAGTASSTTYDRLEAWLDRFDEETAAAEGGAGGDLITFRAEGVFGIASVTVQGPVDNAPETAAAFAALIAQLRDESTRPHPEG